MNAVVFYSNTGESRAVAEYLADKLGYPLFDIENFKNENYENLTLVFPVMCQNIPNRVKELLDGLSVENLSVIATYGRMCYGNVLYEIQNKYKKNIVAAAYLPTKHSYIDNDRSFCDYERLDPFIKKVKAPAPIRLPRLYKNPFANAFPKLRSQAGVKIYKNKQCNNCNLCAKSCSVGAIRSGITDNKCIRCLRCVSACPSNALEFKLRAPLRLYLKKKKIERIIVYI